jgi:hypothetical protein
VVQAIKALRRNGSIAPIILHIELDGGQLSASRRGHFTPAIDSQYPFSYAPQPVSTFSKREETVVPAGIRARDRPSCSQVTVRAGLKVGPSGQLVGAPTYNGR